jgi:hypothetical protein
MNRICPVVIPCPPDNPLGNFSSEAPDPFLFTAFHWPVFDPRNPIGGGRPPVPPVYFAGDCAGICTSGISQAEADLCAARQGYICEHTPPGGHPPTFFFNTQQVCTIDCGNGSTFFWVVPNGEFPGMNQAEADMRAFTYACNQVALHFFCLNDIPNEAQTGVEYDATIFVQEGAPRQPVIFTLVAGTLPPGLNLTTEGPLSTFLHGKPTAAGTFTFTIQATDAQGIFVQKTYTITVTSTCSDFWNALAPTWFFQTFGANSVANRVGTVVAVSAYVRQALDVSGVAEATGTAVAPVTSQFQCSLTVTPIAIINAINTPALQILVQDQVTAAIYLQTGIIVPAAQTVFTFTLPIGAKPLVDFNVSVNNAANGFDSQLAYSIALG